MKIWYTDTNIDELNQLGKNNMGEHLGMKFINVTDDSIEATMPVDFRTKQPFGLLHGGATAALAETLGSVASQMILGERGIAVGMQLNISHLSSARNGEVNGICSPIKIGKRIHVWQIDIFSGKKQISSAQLTTYLKLKQD